MDVFQTAKSSASRLGLVLEPLGGGRIEFLDPPQGQAPGSGQGSEPKLGREGGINVTRRVQRGIPGGPRCLIYG